LKPRAECPAPRLACIGDVDKSLGVSAEFDQEAPQGPERPASRPMNPWPTAYVYPV
jgi:hypothetical protein